MKPQILFIPGLLNDADLFRDQIARLEPRAGITVADITGHGSLTELAQQVLDQAPERFALVGFSLGGIVAQEIIRLAPERISHLALLDTTMLPDSPDRAAERQRLVTLARSPGAFHGFGEALLDSYLAKANRNDMAMITRIRDMTARLGPEVFIRQSLIERPDSQTVLGRVRCPTLVLCGAEDRLTPPALHRDMAISIMPARLVIVPEAGHMTPIEAPEKVTMALERLIFSK